MQRTGYDASLMAPTRLVWHGLDCINFYGFNSLFAGNGFVSVGLLSDFGFLWEKMYVGLFIFRTMELPTSWDVLFQCFLGNFLILMWFNPNTAILNYLKSKSPFTVRTDTSMDFFINVDSMQNYTQPQSLMKPHE